MALALTGATNLIPNRSPDKALCAAIREPSPVALTLTGATDRLPNRSPDKALCAAIRESSAGGAYAYRGYQPTTEP
ncbi:hypothetical protein SM905_22555 [Klebsiella aerogenes]|uniref:hypothetical protein n=1 Tax=Klebsiella aerogenes TaxID=548 RepID=UPI002A6A7D32|nr:hypothetical protein [Klebsiella aerogenes]MDY0848561.1 hypothetical protein [Klebsiella aerogenes]WPS32924.1 hypothetical protein SM905_22555 [Klebsiella aerogenes]